MTALIDHLATLSSAEEFFARLAVPFDPAVVRVSRLHILKRFRQYMEKAGLAPGDGRSAEDQERLCRDALAAAYNDFVVSNPITERVFKVLEEAAPMAAPSFVPLDTVGRFR